MKIIDSFMLINNELSNIAFGSMIDSDLVWQNDLNITVDIMKNSELIGLGKDLFKDSVNILSFHFAIFVCTEDLNRELMYLVIRGVILADYIYFFIFLEKIVFVVLQFINLVIIYIKIH